MFDQLEQQQATRRQQSIFRTRRLNPRKRLRQSPQPTTPVIKIVIFSPNRRAAADEDDDEDDEEVETESDDNDDSISDELIKLLLSPTPPRRQTPSRNRAKQRSARLNRFRPGRQNGFEDAIKLLDSSPLSPGRQKSARKERPVGESSSEADLDLSSLSFKTPPSKSTIIMNRTQIWKRIPKNKTVETAKRKSNRVRPRRSRGFRKRNRQFGSGSGSGFNRFQSIESTQSKISTTKQPSDQWVNKFSSGVGTTRLESVNPATGTSKRQPPGVGQLGPVAKQQPQPSKQPMARVIFKTVVKQFTKTTTPPSKQQSSSSSG